MSATEDNVMNDNDTNRKLTYDEISFIYDSVVRTAIETLFAQKDKHGWSEKEFNEVTQMVIAAEEQKLINRWVH